MREILLIAADWRFRALVRAQLLEEGFSVVALPSLEVAATCLLRRREQPRVTLLDTQRMTVHAGALLDLWRLTRGAPVILCGGMLSRQMLAQEEIVPARVLLRPFSVGDVIEEVRKLIPWPEEAGRSAADSVSDS